MENVNFITQNPGTEAFVRGQQAAQQQMTAQVATEGAITQNAINVAAAPSRLRTINAGADLAQTNANVAGATAPAHISEANSAASLARTNAGVAAQTAPYTVSTAASNASTAGSNAQVAAGTVAPRISEAESGATTAASGAAVAQGTQDTKIQSAKVGLRQQEAGALNTEMQSFYKEIELLDRGDIEGAKAVAAQAGHQIPEALFNDADMRAAMSAAAKQAQTAYPGRPADQQSYIHGFITDITSRKAQGQNASAPAAPYQVPGAPQPQETYLRTGTGGRASVYAQKLQVGEALYGKGSKAAADYAGGLRQMSPQEAAKASYAAARGVLVGMGKAFTEADVTAMAQRIEAQIRTDFGQVGNPATAAPQAPAAPGAPAAPAAASGAPAAPMGNDPLGLR
jgi:hypothetical protein